MGERLRELWERRRAKAQAFRMFTGVWTLDLTPTYLQRTYYCNPGPTPRIVGWVAPEMPRSCWLIPPEQDPLGWYDNDYGESWTDGSGLITGVVGALPGKKGKNRFIAGYQCRGDDCGVWWDASRIWEDFPANCWEDSKAAYDAGRYADGLAEQAAEQARDYARQQQEEDAA